MRILLLAPQPFYVERGTPIAVRLAATALVRAGHRVDVLCFHEGADIALDGLTIYRIPRLRFVRNVPIGLSWKKLVCDVALAGCALQRLRSARYDVVHAVEEAVFIALALRPFFDFRLVYDMDSLMSAQLAERSRAFVWLRPLLWRIERAAIRRADGVLAVCPDIARAAVAAGTVARVDVLPDVALPLAADASPSAIDDLRGLFPEPAPLALYVGNLDRHQGIDLLLQSVALMPARAPCNLVVIGGPIALVAHYRARAEALGISGRVRLIGPRPLAALPRLLEQADILCSPRLAGVNTPMKIYSYMAAGRAIIATDIRAHAQVLDAQCARLVAVSAPAFAEALSALATDRALRLQLGACSQRAGERYGWSAFEQRLQQAYGALAASALAPA